MTRSLVGLRLQKVLAPADAFEQVGLGYLVCVGLCVDGIVVRNHEIKGNPPADEPIMDPEVLTPALQAIYAAEQLLYAGTSLPKLSLLFLYLRIFDSRRIRVTTWVLIGITIVSWITWSLIAFFLCTPVEFYWDRTIPGGHCINIDSFWRSIPPINIFTDAVAIILPIPTIWRLEASRMKKIGVCAILMTGGIGLITGCIRWAVYLSYSAQYIVPSITEPLLGWAIIEAGMYEIAACLPMLRPIFVWLTPSWLSSRWTRDGGSSAYHRNITAPGANRYSAPWRNSKRESAFWRLEEQSQTSPISPTYTEPKAPLSPRENIPLGHVDGIHKTVDVSVTQRRMSQSSGEEADRRLSHGRTHSYAEGEAAYENTTFARL